MNTVKRGFEINSDPNYCSLVLVNRGVTVNEDDNGAEIDIQLYGPATQYYHACWIEERHLLVSNVFNLHFFIVPTAQGLMYILVVMSMNGFCFVVSYTCNVSSQVRALHSYLD